MSPRTPRTAEGPAADRRRPIRTRPATPTRPVLDEYGDPRWSDDGPPPPDEDASQVPPDTEI